jgi:hypothetical protein
LLGVDATAVEYARSVPRRRVAAHWRGSFEVDKFEWVAAYAAAR